MEEGLKLLRKKIALEDDDFDAYMYSVGLLKEMLSSAEAYRKKAVAIYNDWKRLPAVDTDLNVILDELLFFIKI